MVTSPIQTGSLLLPEAYFPPILQYALMAEGKPVCFEQMETFPKQTFRNRCDIMTATGKTSLVVPVSRPRGNHTRTAEIRISFREPWQRTHWRALQASYNSSPYFAYYTGKIEPLIFQKEEVLLQFNHHIINELNILLGIRADISYTENYIKSSDAATDFRTLISPKKAFTQSIFPAYPQVFSHLHGFIPGLSILDLLFNLGPESKQYLERLKIALGH